jgi:hypothetical protein
MKEVLERNPDFVSNPSSDTDDLEIDLTTEDGKLLVSLFGGTLEKLTWLGGEDCLLGCVRLVRAPHHLTLVRVHTVDGVQEATRDPHNRLDDVLRGADSAGDTVELPGFEGEWVLGVDPYRD